MRETPPRLSDVEKKEVTDFSAEYLRTIEKSTAESQGFMNIDAENIRIIPQENGTGGVIEIKPLINQRGIDDFSKRDLFEKDFPQAKLKESAEFENRIFRGEAKAQPFSPEFGARICLAIIKLYETKEGQFISLPILPASGQKYSGHAKISGTNLLRGNKPTPKSLFTGALTKETSNLEKIQKDNPHDKIINKGEYVKTGVWTIRFLNPNGSHYDIRDCHVQRDAQTGTLDVLLINKKIVFAGFDDVLTEEALGNGLQRLNSMVSLEDLKQAEEDKELQLKKVFWGGKEIKRLTDVPAEYMDLFIEREGTLWLKEYKAVPALNAFVEQEKKIIITTDDELEIEIRTGLGKVFEKLLEKTLGTKRNNSYLHTDVTSDENELARLTQGLPQDFIYWTKTVSGKNITVLPDFILTDGTFVEAKLDGRIDIIPEKKDKREQIFRMMLYKLIKGEAPKIKIISLEGETGEDFILPGVQYENILQTGKYDEKDFAEILAWRKRLKEKQEIK